MHQAVRYLLVMAAITLMAVARSDNPSVAATPALKPTPGVALVLPTNGAVVGVAHMVVAFTAPVTDRFAAERSIRITSPTNMTGNFEWLDSNIVQWIPTKYWPAYTHVSVEVQELTTGFETGDTLLGVANLSTHTFTVSRNGEVLRTMPASMGKPTRPTPIGTFTALSKERTVVMDSRTIGIPLSSPEGYLITAYYAVRVTWSGVYVHSAPWSVNSQGHTNVSHGCINLSPDDASWYFNIVNVGDPIEVVA
ncbi:L,D-transpeptidase [Mycobacterium lepromatosis]|uniref:Membrane protein n=1 Tax=Mycobacterium lepromatosis TaxID=480418 RepID=A0A0F4ENE7_9MYCO|nr:L,D-transpeptidase [Mycobacterium lepromatosis]KJX74491.1 membrane protein [Mycobacterium lepromatosis]UKN43144.1 membrane protein [Mycobacterium lepromatosis]